ncbi:MAG: archaeosine biosynthesis radical SAM protein RaSEA, partial [Promethearchaeota archaeon]
MNTEQNNSQSNISQSNQEKQPTTNPAEKSLGHEIQEWVVKQPSFVSVLWPEMQYLRHQPLKKRKIQNPRLDKPVAVFTKEERLKSGMGQEITLIFRSSACAWARSKSGGCTMCGYWNDRAPEGITGEDYWKQFQVALKKFPELIKNPESKIVFKMFTSGSFCDVKEVPEDIQLRIIKELANIPTIKEIVIESRPEYVTDNILQKYRNLLSDQYLEIGVGLETADNFIRTNIINKGFNWKAFDLAFQRLHSFGFGMKAYILFKPPFVSEYASIRDTYNSIRKCVELGVDTISINPTNIQMHTICNELDKRKAFRSPWLYSLLWLLKHAITNEEIKKTRVICDPSASGKERGVHNCHEH